MSETIEVGDVFRYPNIMPDLTAQAVRADAIKADDVWHDKELCTLVRKAAKDRYAGLTLPTPPAGYRLAKWGEEFSPLASGIPKRWWVDHWQVMGWVLPTDYKPSEPGKSIFAVPIDPPASTAPKSWQFRHDPWTPPQPKTLADVPENVDVIAGHCTACSLCHVMFRRGDAAYYRHSNGSEGQVLSRADNWNFVRYLDPPQPAPLRLEDVPDGRVILIDDREHWKTKSGWLRLHRDGTIREAQASVDFTVTDYIAEFREASC